VICQTRIPTGPACSPCGRKFTAGFLDAARRTRRNPALAAKINSSLDPIRKLLLARLMPNLRTDSSPAIVIELFPANCVEIARRAQTDTGVLWQGCDRLDWRARRIVQHLIRSRPAQKA
jgi:hypothetical protein